MVLLQHILEYFSQRGLEVNGLSGDSGVEITGGRNIREAQQKEITFLSSKYLDSADWLFSESKAALVVVDKSVFPILKFSEKKLVVIAEDAKAEMVKCLKHFFSLDRLPGIHATVVIDATARIGTNNFIGAYVVIDKNVTIGNDCIVEPFVHLKANTKIGNRVKIKSGTIIGGSGFGYVQEADKHWENFPHFGKVIIEDNVHIGSNTCIDRGALGDTLIKQGVKIDNLVHIAHNVVIGENSLIIADAMIGGSSEIGSNVWIAPSSSVRNGIQIGANSVVGMGAVVTKSVQEGVTVAGNPAAVFTKGK